MVKNQIVSDQSYKPRKNLLTAIASQTMHYARNVAHYGVVAAQKTGRQFHDHPIRTGLYATGTAFGVAALIGLATISYTGKASNQNAGASNQNNNTGQVSIGGQNDNGSGIILPTPTPFPIPTSTPPPTSTSRSVPTATNTPQSTIQPTTPPNTPTPITDETNILQKLLFYTPQINDCNKDDQHKRIIPAIVTRIKTDLYDNGLAVNENEAWEKYIGPAVKFATPDICIIDVSKYTESDIGQIVLPRELRRIRIMQPYGPNNAVGVTDVNIENAKSLQIGIENVSYDPNLGKSPEQWLRDVMKGEYEKKGARYRRALFAASAPIGNWPNSLKWYQQEFDKLRTVDGEALFILGDGAISQLYIGDPPEDRIKPIVLMSGQMRPYFSILIGSTVFSRPVYLETANYPQTDKSHDQPAVVLKDGRLFSLWTDRLVFESDYVRQPNKPSLTVYPSRGY